MNELDILKAFDAVDDELLERSECAIHRKSKMLQKRYTVIAISILCLIIAICLTVFFKN